MEALPASFVFAPTWWPLALHHLCRLSSCFTHTNKNPCYFNLSLQERAAMGGSKARWEGSARRTHTLSADAVHAAERTHTHSPAQASISFQSLKPKKAFWAESLLMIKAIWLLIKADKWTKACQFNACRSPLCLKMHPLKNKLCNISPQLWPRNWSFYFVKEIKIFEDLLVKEAKKKIINNIYKMLFFSSLFFYL